MASLLGEKKPQKKKKIPKRKKKRPDDQPSIQRTTGFDKGMLDGLADCCYIESPAMQLGVPKILAYRPGYVGQSAKTTRDYSPSPLVLHDQHSIMLAWLYRESRWSNVVGRLTNLAARCFHV